ncbi:YqeB family protein [Paucisalibacillus globulus]|uniref:YqeB family protein n=1 Tax=Paucisalibacillus globulus TaxID=351095 RepID=UPI000424AF9D|nr:hypothetical protein [Paucisalibacillus globulus]
MRETETVLGLSKPEKTLIILVPMILGGLIGWFIPVIADWLLNLPVVPWEKLIEFIASLNSLWISIVASIIGIIAGILLTLIIFEESLEVTITYENLLLKLGDKVDTLDKKDISTIYIENKQLIILGKNSNELYREVFETKIDTVRETFRNYQYPWKEKDPFEKEYQRWVLGHPDFPEKVNALLYAREHALKEDKKKDAKYLREDLAKLGVVIRDERNSQYVRIVKDTN